MQQTLAMMERRQLTPDNELRHWFSIFLMLQHCDTDPYIVVTPKHKII